MGKNVLNSAEKGAAYELSDQVYSILQNTERAMFILSDLYEEFFSVEAADTPEGRERIAVKFERASKQFDIALDYVSSVRVSLRDLDTVTTEIETEV